jgi:hypothetical protein
MVLAPANVSTVATVYIGRILMDYGDVALATGNEISFFDGSQPSVHARAVLDGRHDFSLSASTTTEVLLQPRKCGSRPCHTRFPWPRTGASGHEAVAFHVLTSIT